MTSIFRHRVTVVGAQWWRNFADANRGQDKALVDMLHEWNGYDVYGTHDIEFDTEEDFLMFVLRFS